MGFGNKTVSSTCGWRKDGSEQRRAFVVGVTGVIGSGKTTFCKFLHDKFGFVHIDADKIVHELYKVGRPGYEAIKKHFGAEFARNRRGAKVAVEFGPEINRTSLREFLFKNPKEISRKIRTLNKLIHPLVADEVYKKLVQLKGGRKAKTPLFVCIESVYFDKNNLGKFVDKIITIDAPDEEILRRLASRGIPKKELKAILGFQRKNPS